MYKKLALFISIIIGLSFGCGFFYQNKKSMAQNQVTIQFSSWGSESEIGILKPLLSDFERKNPQIKVEFMHIPQNYFQKLHLLFASNTAPDVVFINNQYLPVYANAGVLEDLSQYDNEIQFKEFYPKSLQALSWKDEIYAIPRDVSNLVIFYNKNLFDKYGVPYPNDNWDYETFLETAKKLTHAPSVFGISFDEEPLFYLPYLMSFGLNDIPVFEDKITNDGLLQYSKLRNVYHVAPKKDEAASATMAQLFLQEHLAMHISGRWLVPKYRQEAKFDWDVAPFPKGISGSVVPLDASGWALAKASKHKKEAIELIKFLSSQESVARFTQSGLIVPARIDIANSSVFLDSQKPKNAKLFLEIIKMSKPTPVSVNYREVLDTLRSKTEKMFNE